jgi:hypothetical protein
MPLRRLFLVIVVLATAPQITGAAPVSPDDASRLYLPSITYSAPGIPLSQIVGLALSDDSPVWGSRDSEIYTIRADGTGLTRLTDNDWQDESPTWSPDGAFIAWSQSDTADPPVHQEAWMMNWDGSGARKLADLPGLRPGPWSPVENRLLLRLDGPQGADYAASRLYVTTPGAVQPTLVAGPMNSGASGWSSVGHWIWFQPDGGASGSYDFPFYTAHPDGSHVTLVAPIYVASAIWSPGDAWIAYAAISGGNLDVYIIRPDGSDRRAVATSRLGEMPGGWVQDGAGLLVIRGLDPDGQRHAVDIYSMASGTTEPFLSPDPTGDLSVWAVSPDGRTVAYEETADGGRTHQLKLRAIASPTAQTISPAFQTLACTSFGGWSWDGRQVVYSRWTFPHPLFFESKLYVANVDGTEPVYWILDRDTHGHTWIPQSQWLSADVPYDGTKLYNPRTGAQLALPRSAERTPLYVTEWHVVQ